MTKQDQSNTAKGKIAEHQAAVFLMQAGYSILARNYRHGRGEIDLVVQQADTIVFVEVKSRKNAAFGNPELAVTPKKQDLLQTTATYFVEHYQLHNPIRFDIIAITGKEIVHLEDVF
jgi:putative endonuclease